MATNDITIIQEQADGSLIERIVTPTAGQVLGFDGSGHPVSVAGGGGGGGGGGGSETPVALTYASTVTPDCDDGLLRKIALGGNLTINPPSNAAEGMKWECWVSCDGSARTLDFGSGVLVPSDSALSLPKTLTASKTYIVLLKRFSSAWGLASIVGGY